MAEPQQINKDNPAAVALSRAAKELRERGVTAPKIPASWAEIVANWLDSLADLYEGGRDE